MKNKKILIIGGSGFFGKSFLKLFINKGLDNWCISDIFIMTRNPGVLNKVFGKKNLKNVTLLKSDISKVKDLPSCDYIIHAATSTDIDLKTNKKNFHNTKNINIKSVSNFLKIIKKKKFQNTKIIYMSSGAVYNKNKIFKKIKETSPISSIVNFNPSNDNLYKYIKIKSENLILNFNQKAKMKIVIARPFAFVGEFLPLNRNYFIGNLFSSIITKKPITIKSPNLKKVFRSYLHADELVQWIMIMLVNANSRTEVFNVGSDQSINLFNLTQFFKKFYHLKNIKNTLNKDSKKLNVDFYIPNIEKIKKKLKINVKISLKRSIRKTYQDLID
tara:strand:+ start:6448 stop:7437 length:990 start_codon:yes stop_codon:yes gene_type:complete